MSTSVNIQRALLSIVAAGLAWSLVTVQAQDAAEVAPAVPAVSETAPAETSEGTAADADSASNPVEEDGVSADTEAAASDEAAEFSLQQVLGLPELRHEAALAEFIAQSLASEVQPGVSRDITARTVKYLRREDAILAALRKNLSLRTAEESIGVFNQALLEAEAVFDPVFDLAFNYKRQDTHQRTEVGNIRKRDFLPNSPIEIPPDPFNPLPQIDQIGFRKESGSTIIREIDASKPRPVGPDEPLEYSVGVTQQLPWGPKVSLFTSLIDRRVYRSGRGDSHKADWSASGVLGMSVPLPFSRNFGPLAPANFATQQSALFDERTDSSLRVILNSIIGATDVAYWQLVRALENLRIASENRKLVQEQVERITKLFEAQMTTEYAKAVIETELARVNVIEESSKNAVIAAANALAPLIEDTGEAVRSNLYIPADYLESMSATAEIDVASAVRKGLDNRPEIRQAHVDLRTRDLERRFAEVQTRPNVEFNGSLSGTQKNDPYGYYEAGQALLKVVDPDTSNFFGALGYQRPWGNVAVKSAHRRAELNQTDQELAISNLEHDVTREVNDALDRLYGARMRLGFADQNLLMAEKAYGRILTRREIGADVAAVEIVTAIQDLLNAKRNRVSSLVDNKIAETQLLAAQGTIASEFTSTDAASPFENRRLDTLRQSGALRYFAPPSAPAAE